MSDACFELGGLPLYSPTLKSRAITMENQRGEVGAGGQKNNGRKGDPCLWVFEKDQVYTFAEIEGPGCIRHIWITVENEGPEMMRNLILRFYWDGQKTPSVEVPLTDFFGVCHGRTKHFESAFVTMAEAKGFNCYFPMPFAKGARLEIANEVGRTVGKFFYQVDYTVGDKVTDETPRFHAQFRRTARTKMKEDFVILDGVKGKGRFLGVNFGLINIFPPGIWWGEGEVKMYLDGDTDFPTICGTGSEDYAGSAWGLGEFHTREFGAPLSGERYVSFYRWHERDPIYFSESIKVTMQQIGNDGHWDPADPDGKLGEFVRDGRYLKEKRDGCFEREDDVCSTAYWYQTLPTQSFPEFPGRELRSLDLR